MTDLQLNLQGVYYLTYQFETFALCISNIEEKFECGTPARFIRANFIRYKMLIRY